MYEKDGSFHIWLGSNCYKCRYTHDGRYGHCQISDIFACGLSSDSPVIFLVDTSLASL